MRSLVVGSLLLCAALARADEGMWTVNDFPTALVQQRYGFQPTQPWLDHVRLSSVRFDSGGSGSFISPTGLVMTNHHVGADCMAKLGHTDRDYHQDGFYAKIAADEMRCPDLELDVLTGIEDVSKLVRASEKPGASDADSARSRREAMSVIEKDCSRKPGQRCDVVTLYRGARYDLYQYKKYTDVRLVFAPELGIAFFGGDHDKLSYPRYDLDVAIFRAYEGGKAAAPRDYLRFSPDGAREGELVFTAGHPGATLRLSTQAMQQTLRDVIYPLVIAELERMRAVLGEFGARGAEQERSARKLRFSIETRYRVLGAYLDGLKDPELMEKKAAAEASLRRAFAAKPATAGALAAWTTIEQAEKASRAIFTRSFLLEGGGDQLSEQNAFNSTLFGIARTLVRLDDERDLPDAKRLRELADAGRKSLELALYSAAPIDLDLEEALLASALSRLAQRLGEKDPAVKAALGGTTPAARARELVRGTKLGDVAVRRALAASKEALVAAHDPMIVVARAVDAEARAVRKRWEDEVEGPEEPALGQIARAQAEAAGAAISPDATFTLRISFGKVAGYHDGTHNVPPITVLGGLFVKAQKASNQPPWQLPPRWLAAKPRLKATTPMNFVSTTDTIVGNSGSPVVNRAAEIVGLVFDSNIQLLANYFVYREGLGRTINVSSVGLLDVLRKVYDAGALVEEITGQKASPL